MKRWLRWVAAKEAEPVGWRVLLATSRALASYLCVAVATMLLCWIAFGKEAFMDFHGQVDMAWAATWYLVMWPWQLFLLLMRVVVFPMMSLVDRLRHR